MALVARLDLTLGCQAGCGIGFGSRLGDWMIAEKSVVTRDAFLEEQGE